MTIWKALGVGSIISKLSPKDKKLLSEFHGTDTHLALLHLNKLVKANAADKGLTAVDFFEVKHLQGQKAALDRQEEELNKLYKATQKWPSTKPKKTGQGFLG